MIAEGLMQQVASVIQPLTQPLKGPLSDHSPRRDVTSGNLSILKLWLVYGSWCASAGWLLSVVHQLNLKGYAIAAILSVLAAAVMIRLRGGRKPLGRLDIRFPWRRFCRPLPAIYAFLALCSIAGGLVHAPNNYDMLTYRLPRILNWLADGRWHWVRTYIDRINYSGTGWEWDVTPLILIARNTSLVFLVNIVSYLLLPGLSFAFLQRLGVVNRVAWTWMWIVPAGQIFVMQAGGGANDMVSVVFLLSAIVFALRAKQNRQVSDVFWSIISAALLTGCKSSNLPLMLPCLVSLIPVLHLLKRHLWTTILVVMVAVLSSILPILAMNVKYSHDWTGSPGDPYQLRVHNSLAGLLGNSLAIGVFSLQPPVTPMAGLWNANWSHLLPAKLIAFLGREFPRFSLHMAELPQEERDGLGAGVTLMAVASVVAGLVETVRNPSRSRRWSSTFRGNLRWWIVGAGVIALGAFMSTLGSESVPRLASPYYPFLLAPMLFPVKAAVTRRRWWHWGAILASLSVIPGVILTPSRPLFPAVRWSSQVASAFPSSAVARRSALVYKVYADRADNLAPLRRYLPADTNVVGIFASSDASETPLWQPYFSRRVIEIQPDDTAETLRHDGIRFVVVGQDGLDDQRVSLADFLRQFGGKVVGRETIILHITEGPEKWYVIDRDAR